MKKLIPVKVLVLILLVMTTAPSWAQQQLRTAWFMEHAYGRNAMNPAFRPATGYIGIPALNNLSISYNSSNITLNEFFIHHDGEYKTILDTEILTPEFIENLADLSNLNIKTSIDILSGGWWYGKGFWTVGLNLRSDISADIPRDLILFTKNSSQMTLGLDDRYDLRKMRVNTQNYMEWAVGYSREIIPRLVVGGRAKILTGLAHGELTFDRFEVVGDDLQSRITSRGHMRLAMNNSKFKYDSDGFISGFDINGIGLAGWGLGFDLGVEYEIIHNLKVSAALLDVGFIRWGKNSTIDSYSDEELDYTSFMGQSNAGEVLLELARFEEVDPDPFTTSLRSTFNVGVNYLMNNNIVGFGLLSSTRFMKSNTYTEFTAAVTANPIKWFTGAVSYSFVHSRFKTLGLALNFAPKNFNFTLGTDYLITGFDHAIPRNVRSFNIYLGMSVPLSRNTKAVYKPALAL